MPDGRTIKNPYSIPGLVINFSGYDALIELFYPIKFYNCQFNMMNKSRITIHKSYGINNMIVDAYNESDVFLDENVGIGGCHVHMVNEKGTSLKISKNTALSYGIDIYTTDTHPILNMQKDCINNKKSCVTIGEHVWICAACVLLKGARIPNDVVLGHSSVCSKKLEKSNAIYAGNPCKCVKEGITWKGGPLD